MVEVIVSIVSCLTAVAALLISAVSFRRSSSDARIDERIDLKLAPDIAVIKNELATITASVTKQSEQTAVAVRTAVDATAAAIREAAQAIVDARRVA